MPKTYEKLIATEAWLAHVSNARGNETAALMQQVVGLYRGVDPVLLQKGLSIADILLQLGLDKEAMAVAIAYPLFQAQIMHTDFMIEQFHEHTVHLLKDVLKMQSLGQLHQREQQGEHHTEKWRQMLLAMVTDIRSVLIILAEYLYLLRQAKESTQSEQVSIAQTALTVYAPLANRLGIWQLKWEIEDLSLRYLEPDTYKKIAQSLASKRVEREVDLGEVNHLLVTLLHENGISDFQVNSRAKHIYSIYKKMLRKNIGMENIYDISALRVLVRHVDDCYHVLSLIQEMWPQIHHEFDDYIAHPKPNGYRSIHIVIVGPKNKNIEIQIRTYDMHEQSELGVASHWRYKEGIMQSLDNELKIALLREVIAWHKELASQGSVSPKEKIPDLLSDRVYVFTPTGEIIDLNKGATPLDFAYAIHSEVGHRCRGAKVNNKLVQLTYSLKTGDRIEIMTGKQANPSRDWLNTHLGYLKTKRAVAKVQHWFKTQDSLLKEDEDDASLEDNKEKRHIPLPTIMQKDKKIPDGKITSDVGIEGINRLLTYMARCCKPLPGDPILGYITRKGGVTIHRKDCRTLSRDSKNRDRFIDVAWSQKQQNQYLVTLLIKIMETPGILQKISTLLAGEKIHVVAIEMQKTDDAVICDIYLTVNVKNHEALKKVYDVLKQLPQLIALQRK